MNQPMSEEETPTLAISLQVNAVKNDQGICDKRGFRLQMEQSLLSPYNMRRLHRGGREYILTIPYHTSEEIERIISELLREMQELADQSHCLLEADVTALDRSGRHWQLA